MFCGLYWFNLLLYFSYYFGHKKNCYRWKKSFIEFFSTLSPSLSTIQCFPTQPIDSGLGRIVFRLLIYMTFDTRIKPRSRVNIMFFSSAQFVRWLKLLPWLKERECGMCVCFCLFNVCPPQWRREKSTIIFVSIKFDRNRIKNNIEKWISEGKTLIHGCETPLLVVGMALNTLDVYSFHKQCTIPSWQ